MIDTLLNQWSINNPVWTTFIIVYVILVEITYFVVLTIEKKNKMKPVSHWACVKMYCVMFAFLELSVIYFLIGIIDKYYGHKVIWLAELIIQYWMSGLWAIIVFIIWFWLNKKIAEVIRKPKSKKLKGDK